MTKEEEKKKKNREAQRRFREKDKDRYNAYQTEWRKKRQEEFQRLKEFYEKHNNES